MPHFTMEYSANLDGAVDFAAPAARPCMKPSWHRACSSLAQSASVPSGAEAYAVADLLPENGFIDMFFRVGKGRSEAERHETGEAIFATVTRFLAPLFEHAAFCARRSRSARSTRTSAGRKTPSTRGCARNRVEPIPPGYPPDRPRATVPHRSIECRSSTKTSPRPRPISPGSMNGVMNRIGGEDVCGRRWRDLRDDLAG